MSKKKRNRKTKKKQIVTKPLVALTEFANTNKIQQKKNINNNNNTATKVKKKRAEGQTSHFEKESKCIHC